MSCRTGYSGCLKNFFCKVSKRSWTTISIVSINEGLDPIVIKVNKTE